jgi:hypothetical protein
MGVEPSKSCPSQILEAQRREFFLALVIAARFKVVIDKAIALARQAQDRYEENANRHRMDTTSYHVKDYHTG